MYLFYTNKIDEEWAVLEEAEARHCVQVLRMKVDDPIQFVDGDGNWYFGRLATLHKKECRIAIERRQTQAPASTVDLHLAVAPTKNIDRFEWFLEKATEIGISQVTPLLCKRSERKKLRPERLERVLIAAMKQSLKAQLPSLRPLQKLEDFLTEVKAEQKFIAHCNDGEKKLLKDIYRPGKSVCILIGPEGDFLEQEVEVAQQKGFEAISLGEARLRTETAALVACHSINFMNQ